MHEQDIYEAFMEFYGIQSIDQHQGEWLGRQQAKAMTGAWLRERGFEHRAASMMVYKMFKNNKEKILHGEI